MVRSVQLMALFLVALPVPGAAQNRDASPPSGWAAQYPTNIKYAGITQAERAAAVALLAEVERVLWRIPEIAKPVEFVVTKQYIGGSRPIAVPNGVAQYSLTLWFFARSGPDRQVAVEGRKLISVTVNFDPGSQATDAQGRPIIIEPDAIPAIPGAVASYGSVPDTEPISMSAVFTKDGVFPWDPVSRETYLRSLIAEAEGPKGERTAEIRKSLEKTPYEQWMAEGPERKKQRDELALSLRGIKTKEEIAQIIKDQEAAEREVTERLKASDAEARERNAQASQAATSVGDGFRAEIAAMSPEERARPARVEKNGQLLPVDATNGTRVLTPKLELWRVRRSPVEVHSISVSIGGATGEGKAYDEVVMALRETFRKLDWASIKRIVDTSP